MWRKRLRDLLLYKKYLKFDALEEMIKEFQSTLLESNMTFSYFCDWDKIKKNVERYTYEINTLNYLVGAANPKDKLKEILKKNPETLKVIPLIIAVRDLDIVVIRDPEKPMETLTKYDFAKKLPSDADIKDIISFCEESGVLALFSDFRIKDLRDYLVGVETGLDTNARKNRSGSAMESLISPILNKIKGIKIYSQSKFGKLAEKFNISIDEGLKVRKFDYAVVFGKKRYNIEVNYYSGQGSKPQEIVDSYINRNNELKRSGWQFIWITDGVGWKSGTNQLSKAFREMDYVLNISMAKQGILNDILKV